MTDQNLDDAVGTGPVAVAVPLRHDEVNANDLAAIRHLVDSFAIALDRRDSEHFGGVFTEDALLRTRSGKVVRGREQISTAFHTLDAFLFTAHHVTNCLVEPQGDTAKGIVYCIAHHFYERDGLLSDQVIYLHYRDTYRREQDAWRISERILVMDWLEERPTLSKDRGDVSSFGRFADA